MVLSMYGETQPIFSCFEHIGLCSAHITRSSGHELEPCQTLLGAMRLCPHEPHKLIGRMLPKGSSLARNVTQGSRDLFLVCKRLRRIVQHIQFSHILFCFVLCEIIESQTLLNVTRQRLAFNFVNIPRMTVNIYL